MPLDVNEQFVNATSNLSQRPNLQLMRIMKIIVFLVVPGLTGIHTVFHQPGIPVLVPVMLVRHSAVVHRPFDIRIIQLSNNVVQTGEQSQWEDVKLTIKYLCHISLNISPYISPCQ